MNTQSSGHQAVDHTADLAIRAWAPDLPGLIEQAARGMLSLILDERPAATERREIAAEGPSDEDLLIDCLREILAMVNVERLVPVSVDVTDAENGTARCEVGVTPIARAGDAMTEEIKAVTYHNLEIVRARGHLEVTVVFDV